MADLESADHLEWEEILQEVHRLRGRCKTLEDSVKHQTEVISKVDWENEEKTREVAEMSTYVCGLAVVPHWCPYIT